jgi:hypothetical protein
VVNFSTLLNIYEIKKKINRKNNECDGITRGGIVQFISYSTKNITCIKQKNIEIWGAVTDGKKWIFMKSVPKYYAKHQYPDITYYKTNIMDSSKNEDLEKIVSIIYFHFFRLTIFKSQAENINKFNNFFDSDKISIIKKNKENNYLITDLLGRNCNRFIFRGLDLKSKKYVHIKIEKFNCSENKKQLDMEIFF